MTAVRYQLINTLRKLLKEADRNVVGGSRRDSEFRSGVHVGAVIRRCKKKVTVNVE